MKVFSIIRLLVMLILLMIAACQPEAQTTDALPTLIDLDAISTNDAATVTAAAETQAAIAASSQPPTLPPTWTPSPVPTDVATLTPNPTATPVVGSGHLFYIFNADSIVKLSADGSFEQLILTGGAPTGLSLSPDGMRLAYAAQGNGSAREVFISNLDGTAVQQVSCVGFPRVIAPTWSPDGQTLVFAASQTTDGPLGIYTLSANGGQCPTENNQRLVAQTEINTLADFTWHSDGTKVFFASETIYGVDVVNGVLYPPLTQTTGYGPDFAPAHHPTQPLLLYVKTVRDDRTGSIGGRIFRIESGDIAAPPLQEIADTLVAARTMQWNADGRYLLINTERDVWIQDQQTRTSMQAVQGSNFFPQAVLSPDAAFVAYVDGGFGARTIQQIYMVSRDGKNPTQITAHQEGTISDLNWSSY